MSKHRLLRNTFSSTTVVGTLLLAPPTYALTTLEYFDLTLEQLLEVKVHSVSKKAEPVATAPAAIYVVTSEDIIRSGVTTIPDALRMVPGIQVARTDSNSWAISIRGFNSGLANKLLVLVDGRTIYNPVFGGVLWEAHILMLEDVERIEVVRGPGGTLWGANAVNGVINIISKHTRDTQGNLTSAVYGNEEKGTLSTRQGGSFGDDGAYRIYAKAFKQDTSLKPPTATSDKQPDTYDEWDGFRTGFRADWADKFTLQGDAYRTDTDQLRPEFSLIAPYAPIRQQRIRYEGINLLGRWTDKHQDGSQLSIQTYVDWAKRDEPFNFIDDRITYDLDAQYNLAPLATHNIIIGAGYRYLTDDQQGDKNTSFSPQQRHNSLYSAFAQDKITLMPDAWFLTLGAKFEHNNFSGFEFQPNARLQWHPDQRQTFWASISRAVRTPTPIEEDLTSTLATAANVRAAFIPNDHFKSEKLTAYELGYRRQLSPEVSVDIATFYNDYDYLSTTMADTENVTFVNNGVDPPHLFIPFIFTNNMQGTSEGIETAINWSVNPDLKITVNYSYLHMSLTALNPEQEGAAGLAPEHQAGLKIFWNISNNWTLDTTTTYVDELPAINVDSYIRLDINLSTRLSKTLRINITGQNLTDSSHREFGSVADINVGEIERSVFAKLTWEF
ncbi:MAG: TonB-dependent receptor [Cellvibrio sp.]|uniref:TonB-dependent receptor plug domain-containing protein n=1 Tax=Cellvibrio sp. TaxID=1965322 RepID=UPI0027228D03|nr:TonB-dependent receptor [Cellvibrio sp.]